MANYYGEARTNYFHVKDEEAFLKAMEDVPGIDIQSDANGFVILGNDDDGYNTWYKWTVDDEELDIPQMVAEHLADGEVAVFMEVGHEKLRYLTGGAVAVNSEGEEVIVSIIDIYKLAAAHFGINEEEISRAEY